MSSETPEPAVTPERRSLWRDMATAEDWWAIWVGGLILLGAWLAVSVGPGEGDGPPQVSSPLKGRFALPSSWMDDPRDGFFKETKKKGAPSEYKPLAGGVAASGLAILVLFAGAVQVMGGSAVRFAVGFVPVFLLAVLAYLMAGQKGIESLNLEYALWARRRSSRRRCAPSSTSRPAWCCWGPRCC
jgi:hypothetical protein